MPWRNSGLIQEVLLALGTSVAVVMGLLAKIAHEVKRGERERFFTRRLWLDAPALVVMITIAAGIKDNTTSNILLIFIGTVAFLYVLI